MVSVFKAVWTSSWITQLANVDILFGENDYGFRGDGDCRMKVSTFSSVIIQAGVGCWGRFSVNDDTMGPKQAGRAEEKWENTLKFSRYIC